MGTPIFYADKHRDLSGELWCNDDSWELATQEEPPSYGTVCLVVFAPPVAAKQLKPDFHPPAAAAWQADRPETSNPVPFSVDQYLNLNVGPTVSGPLQLDAV